jgi:hypothetical protein
VSRDALSRMLLKGMEQRLTVYRVWLWSLMIVLRCDCDHARLVSQ